MTLALGLAADLSHAVLRALEMSDNVFMVLEERDDALLIVAANDQACEMTGTAMATLIGRRITSLIASDNDPAELERLMTAVRERKPCRLHLHCQTPARHPFTFGLHLMPCPDSDAGRFVVVGLDITEKLRREAQEQAAQELLAKVFVIVEVPVYILDLSGRLLMTNPAFERLVGAAPGGLAARNVLDCYAPDSHAAIAAARDRQNEDGLDYKLDVMVRRAAGDEVAAHMTGVIVQRPDLKRFRVVTLTVSASPVAAPAASVLAASRIQLIGLADVREALGARWDALATRAMATAEHVLRRRLAPADTFTAIDEQSFVVCFADISVEEAAFRAAGIGQEIRARLVGAGEDAEASHVFSVATDIPAQTVDLPPAHLSAVLQDRLDRKLESIRETARGRLHQTLQNTRYEIEPVHSRQRDAAIGCCVRLPRAAEQAVFSALAVLPAAETQTFDIDALTLGFARECIADDALRGVTRLVFADVSVDALLVRNRVRAFLELCRTVDEQAKQRLVFVVPVPPDTARIQLLEAFRRLRPFCRILAVASDTLERPKLDFSELYPSIMIVDARHCTGMTEADPRLAALAATLHTQRSRLMLRGAGSPEEAKFAFARGCDFVSMAPSAA